MADVACPIAMSASFGLLVGWIFLISLLRRPLVWFRMFGMFIRDELGVVPYDVVLALKGCCL